MADVTFSEKGLQAFYEYTEELEHHGILGQKWGRKQGPPYPLDAGDHSAAEKKAGWRDSLKETASKVKSAADETANKVKSTVKSTAEHFAKKQKPDPPKAEVEKPKETPEKKEETPEERKAREAEEKRRIVNSGDAELVKQNADKLTYQELSEAVNRVNLMSQLDRNIPIPEPTQNKIDTAIDLIDKNATRIKKGIDTYNKVADIYNRFSDPPLPVIDKSLKDRKEKEESEHKYNILIKHPDKWKDAFTTLDDETAARLAKRSASLNTINKYLNGDTSDDNNNGGNNNNNQNQNNNNQQQGSGKKKKNKNNGGNQQQNSDSSQNNQNSNNNSQNQNNQNQNNNTQNQNGQNQNQQQGGGKGNKGKKGGGQTPEQKQEYESGLAAYNQALKERQREAQEKDTAWSIVTREHYKRDFESYANSLSDSDHIFSRLDENERYGFHHSEFED